MPGFGAACFAGLSAARDEFVCFMDCDASFDPRDLPRVVNPVRDGAADLMLGARQPIQRGVWPLHAGRRTGCWPSSCAAARRCRCATSARCAPRAARRCSALGIQDRRFGWPLEMVLRAADAGWTIREVPVAYHPRDGRSKVTGTLRGTVRAVRDMTNVLR